MSAREEALAEAARLHEEAAGELEQAGRHCARAAEHFRAGDVPRGAAHAWAATGHVRAAQDRLDQQARDHAARSNV